MKAVLVRDFGPPGTAKVETIDTPKPKAHEVLVATALAPVNFVDTLVLEGKYQFLPDRPFVPGKGPVGTVVDVGADVTDLKAGDRVLAMVEQGGYAESFCADAGQCYRLPNKMSFEDAACLSLAYDTAWFALFERARFKSGDNVLVLGATGAVGRAAVQLARAKGANVIAGVSSLERGRSMLGNEAQHYVELSGPDLKENLRKQVFDLTGGKGADIVIDPLGGDIFDAAIRCVAWRGRFVIIGFAAGKIPSLKMNYVLLKNIEVSGLQISDYRKRTPELLRECFNDVFDLYEQGKIMTGKVFRFSLDDYSSALRGILDRSLKGRAVLVP